MLEKGPTQKLPHQEEPTSLSREMERGSRRNGKTMPV